MATEPRQRIPQSGEYITLAEYFQLDTIAPTLKYEYQDGKVRLMAGGSKAHDDIAFNMRVALKQQLQSGPCFVQGSDMRVQVSEADGTYLYPDVTISCDVADRRRDNTLIRSPRVVVEVLSPSTEKDDRTSKMLAYQACPTIHEIVLISQFAPHVEIYRRHNDGTKWGYTIYRPESAAEIVLKSIDITISLAEIYQEINFDEPLIDK
jgi:Uma2 family endonuclease